MSSTIEIAQIGCGYWGPNLLRNFSAVKGCRVKYLADLSEERRKFVAQSFPATHAIAEIDAILNDREINAVVIATPAGNHFELGRRALLAGKHIFVEKPLATTVAEVDELAQLAAERKLQVMVGHTFLYNSAVRYVRKMIEGGELGELRYIYSQRLNLGRIRSDIDALWNFAPHDIAIIQYWLGDPEPEEVTRHGMDFIQPGVQDVVFLNIKYPQKVMANIHVSWLDPQKTRKMVVVGSKKMVVYDDAAEDKIAIYDKGIDRKAVLGQNMDYDKPMSAQFSYRSGDILLPQINFIEPLRAEADHFVDCVRRNVTPLTGIDHARKVVRILEQASR
ncbi:Gfo/Idh/MocA family oxidoreductase [Horticoccus luteus]|uniref:Gfo/Idh/MocA family oxidoreductase n=1 Tax=Horticoccus luteus TaxID=2862869 RepID=A0A8F9XF03_9BACT|nr:Gfo/Idh/MocA family oxidoreductase [Horticoccus luteus]QYM77527.1 Gfo/Idh/MocA family oxidoreductase [Horticoccus luteus]